ncbi:hypothetical protein [Alicyclobacillus macrosporangiidus]|uniref:Uncharacterized protein n=1 Tax=Alicyclobacillus macrosporangiidus TaxID=392015 RepID=A0A1I7H0X4_9BACL|nr:hypothetical protein [Alicyclobacillus macrosporangiidus]SFU54325.1 hypothetical protein SAMN05421543_103170 [Alicyclobacillus macrosporangiidus]
MKGSAKRYVIQVSVSMAVYIVSLLLSIWLLQTYPHGGWRLPIAVLPVLPLCVVVWAAIQFVSGLDELQRSIHLQAVTFSFLVTVVLTLTYGFLEQAGLPHIPVLYVPLLMCALWGIGAGVASRKYR